MIKKCVLCGEEVTGIKYVVPVSPNKPICQKCNDCIDLCRAGRKDEATQRARAFLNSQTEKNSDPKVLTYLMSILQSEEDGETSNITPSSEENFVTNTLINKDEGGIFKNIGSTIKEVTKILFYLEAALCFAVGIVLISKDSYYTSTATIGFAVLLAGPLSAWIVSIFLYGFGELIEQSTRQNQLLSVLISKSYKNEVK